MSNTPYQLLHGPLEVYVAPVGEAFPDVDETPAGNWLKLGDSGKEDIADGGLIVRHDQEIVEIRTDGSTGPRKLLRVSEGQEFEFNLVDSSLEHVHELFDQATITDTAAGAGTPGYRQINTYRGGGEPTDVALLVKGNVTPYGTAAAGATAFASQYEVPVAAVISSPSVVWAKGEVVMWQFIFATKEDPSAATEGARFGTLNMQDAVAI